MPGSLWGPGIFVFPVWALWSSAHRDLSTAPTFGECVGKRRDGSVCVVAEYALHRRHELSRQDVRSRYRRLYRDVYVHNDVQLTATLAGLSAAAMLGAKWLDCDAPAEILRTDRHSQPDMVAHSYRVLDEEVCLAAGYRSRLRLGRLSTSAAGMPAVGQFRCSMLCSRQPAPRSPTSMLLRTVGRELAVYVDSAWRLNWWTPGRSHRRRAGCG